MAEPIPIPIAVIGIGCRFPGGAHDTEKLWRMLCNGQSAWSDVPPDRYNWRSFHDTDPEMSGTTNQRGGHFLDQDVSAFDAAFFGIPPVEAQAMDPQQRILLETAYEALENAGIPLQSLRGSSTAVYVASFSRDYDRMMYRDVDYLPKYHVTGNGAAILANRISYVFDLNGPSMTLDSGCSGSLVALHLACQSLRTGESSVALAAGTNLILSPDVAIELSNLGLLNDDGKCYSFDSRGAGYGRGEGVGVVALKRLDDALQAGDPIRAVVRNTAVNHDGKTTGITLPNKEAQQDLLRSIYRGVNLDPRDTDYVEAHGTGTLVGDAVELGAIADVFCRDRRRDSGLYVGSVKSNIGHLEAASGIAGFIKAVLILEKGLIPPNLNLETPKESLHLADWKITVPLRLTSWPKSGTRRASVNSFGYGGTNTHAILETSPLSVFLNKLGQGGVNGHINDYPVNGHSQDVELNRRSKENAVCGRAERQVNGHSVDDVVDGNSRTYPVGSHIQRCTAGRPAMNGDHSDIDVNSNSLGTDVNIEASVVPEQLKAGAVRRDVSEMLPKTTAVNHVANLRGDTPRTYQLLVTSAKSEKSLLKVVDRLRKWISNSVHSETQLKDLAHTLSVRRTAMQWRCSFVATHQELLSSLDIVRPVKAQSDVQVSLIFTGQGAQWFAMGRDLLLNDSEFRRSLDISDSILRSFGAPWALLEELLRDETTSRINQSEIGQPASTAIQIALVDTLKMLGVRPRAVIGHSSGEIAAAYAAGILSRTMALKVAYQRSFLSGNVRRALKRGGAMLAVDVGEKDVLELIDHLKEGVVCVACVNSPSNTTVSGDEAAITELKCLLDTASIFNRRLKVDTAYHSHHMRTVSDQYLKSLDGLEAHALQSSTSFISSATATEKTSNFGPSYWVENLVSKVRFSDAIEQFCRITQASIPSTAVAPVHILIEVGPHNALSSPIRQTITHLNLKSLKYVYHPSLVRGCSASWSMLDLTGKLFELGVPVNFEVIDSMNMSSHRATVVPDLPPYPWDHSVKFWDEPRLSREFRFRQHPRHDLLGSRMAGTSVLEPRWRNIISVERLPWLQDHVADGFISFPASAYICMVIEAVRQIFEDRQKPGVIINYALKAVSFSKPLLVPEAPATAELQLSLTQSRATGDDVASEWEQFRIVSLSQDGEWSERCCGFVTAELAPSSEAAEEWVQDAITASNVEPLLREMLQAPIERLDSHSLYYQLRSSGKAYGNRFATIREVEIGHRHAVATQAVTEVSEGIPSKSYVVHPATLDAMLMHTAYALFTRHCSPGCVEPVSMGQLNILPNFGSSNGEEVTITTTITPEGRYKARVDLSVLQGSKLSQRKPVLSFRDCEMRRVVKQDEAQHSPTQHDISYRIDWKTDVDFLTSEILGTPELTSQAESALAEQQLSLNEQAACLYIKACLDQVANQALSIPKKHHIALLNWMRDYQNSESYRCVTNEKAGLDVESCLRQAGETNVHGELLSRIGTKLASILTGELEPLSTMLEDDLLYRFYANHRASMRCYSHMVNYVRHLAFKQPDMKVLEIGAGTAGATVPLLQAFSHEGGLSLRRYDFTDISSGFFERAKPLLQEWQNFIRFQVLDIERDPLEQGFDEATYDFVVAVNVLHATSCINSTLSHVRKLLKPGGRLLMIEVTRLLSIYNLTFGVLPGWWAGIEDGREDSPILSVEQWSSALVRNSFTGVDIAAKDYEGPAHECTMMVSEAVLPIVTPRAQHVEIICQTNPDSSRHELAEELASNFAKMEMQSSVTPWPSLVVRRDVVYVVVDDGPKSPLADPTAALFGRIRELVIDGSCILWVTVQPSTSANEDPEKDLVTGLARVARAENEGLKFVTLAVRLSNPSEQRNHVRVISDILLVSFIGDQRAISDETEYLYEDGGVLIPRLKPNVVANAWLDQGLNEPKLEPGFFHQAGRPLKLDLRTPGKVDSLRFIDDETAQRPLRPYEIEVEVRAAAINPQEVSEPLMGTGVWTPVVGQFAGVVSSVGSNFESQFQIGDHVCGCGGSAYSSHTRVNGRTAHLLPSSMPFPTGATVPVFMSAYHSLANVARVRKGQTILIHSAGRGVGQAALIVAQCLEVEVFATYDSASERDLLLNELNVPKSHLFPNKLGCLDKRSLQAAAGTGFDVILYSGPWASIDEIVPCIGKFGTVIEVAQGTSARKKRPSVEALSGNITYASVDLALMIEHRADETGRLMSEVLDMMAAGTLAPLKPIMTMAITEVEEAFRMIKDERYNGILVLEARKGAMVKVVQATPSRLRLRADGTYVVAGGLGALGQEICRHIAKHGAKQILVLTRRSFDAKRRETFEKTLQSFGTSVRIESCDISDVCKVKKVASRCHEDGLPIVRGVINSAMVLPRRTLERMTVAEFNLAIRPKLHGTRNLNKVFQSKCLDFFIMLSSYASILGLKGAASYAAGNAFQDAFAHSQSGLVTHYMALNLGLIEPEALAVQQHEHTQQLVRQGSKMVQFSEFLALLDYSMSGQARNDQCRQVIVGIDGRAFSDDKRPQALRNPLFSHLSRSSLSTGPEQNSGSKTKRVAEAIAAGQSFEEVHGITARAIADRISNLTALDYEEVRLEVSLADFGLDSLVAIELKRWIYRTFGVAVENIGATKASTVSALAREIIERSPLVKAKLQGQHDGIDNADR